VRITLFRNALQYLGNVAFREPVPLPNIPPRVSASRGENPFRSDASEESERLAWEAEILQDCARRLVIQRLGIGEQTVIGPQLPVFSGEETRMEV